jgi:hypothetical protein
MSTQSLLLASSYQNYEEEKAIEITLDNGSFSNTAKAWFPKKAILNKNGFYQLAHWFRPNMYLTKIFNNFSHHSIIAV